MKPGGDAWILSFGLEKSVDLEKMVVMVLDLKVPIMLCHQYMSYMSPALWSLHVLLISG